MPSQKLTKYQKELLNDLIGILPANTHKIAVELGHSQAYETPLRNRLFTLAERGLLEYKEKKGPAGACTSRTWISKRTWGAALIKNLGE